MCRGPSARPAGGRWRSTPCSRCCWPRWRGLSAGCGPRTRPSSPAWCWCWWRWCCGGPGPGGPGYRPRAAVRESLAAADSERAAQLATLQGQRAELAREVHDLVGHSLAVIIAQADSVRFRNLAAADAPEQVQATVAAIAATARDSLGEIREVLTRLGSAGDAATGPAAGEAPPGPATADAASGPSAGGTLPELLARS